MRNPEASMRPQPKINAELGKTSLFFPLWLRFGDEDAMVKNASQINMPQSQTKQGLTLRDAN